MDCFNKNTVQGQRKRSVSSSSSNDDKHHDRKKKAAIAGGVVAAGTAVAVHKHRHPSRSSSRSSSSSKGKKVATGATGAKVGHRAQLKQKVNNLLHKNEQPTTTTHPSNEIVHIEQETYTKKY